MGRLERMWLLAGRVERIVGKLWKVDQNLGELRDVIEGQRSSLRMRPSGFWGIRTPLATEKTVNAHIRRTAT